MRAEQLPRKRRRGSGGKRLALSATTTAASQYWHGARVYHPALREIYG